jgi:hypothetical protein
MPDITFHVRCSTRPGESIWLAGSCSQLGNWVPQHGIQMKTTPGDYPVWKSESLSLPYDVEYKYVVEGAGSKLRWEPCPNRRLPKTHGRIHGATLLEFYGHDPVKNTWWTESSNVTTLTSKADRNLIDHHVTKEIPPRPRDVDIFQVLVLNAGLEQELAQAKADLAKAHEEIAALKTGAGRRRALVEPESERNPSSCMFIDLCAQDVDEADAEYYPDEQFSPSAMRAAHETATKAFHRKESSHASAQKSVDEADASLTRPKLRKLKLPLRKESTEGNQLNMAHSPRRGTPRELTPRSLEGNQLKMAHSHSGTPRGPSEVLLAQVQESKVLHSHDPGLCAEKEQTPEKRRLQKSNTAPVAFEELSVSKLQETKQLADASLTKPLLRKLNLPLRNEATEGNQLSMAHSPRRGTPRELTPRSLEGNVSSGNALKMAHSPRRGTPRGPSESSPSQVQDSKLLQVEEDEDFEEEEESEEEEEDREAEDENEENRVCSLPPHSLLMRSYSHRSM